MVSTLEQMQFPNGEGPGVRKSKRPLLASSTHCKCPMETSRNRVMTSKTVIKCMIWPIHLTLVSKWLLKRENSMCVFFITRKFREVRTWTHGNRLTTSVWLYLSLILTNQPHHTNYLVFAFVQMYMVVFSCRCHDTLRVPLSFEVNNEVQWRLIVFSNIQCKLYETDYKKLVFLHYQFILNIHKHLNWCIIHFVSIPITSCQLFDAMFATLQVIHYKVIAIKFHILLIVRPNERFPTFFCFACWQQTVYGDVVRVIYRATSPGTRV